MLLHVTPQKVSKEGVLQKVRGYHEMTRSARHGPGTFLYLLLSMLLLMSLYIDSYF